MMKRNLVMIVVLFTGIQFAQVPKSGGNQFTGGLGFTNIDGDMFYALRLTPEASFGKFGIGLDLNLEFNTSGNLRTENFNTVSDYLSIIRYFRYGQKNEPVYFQAGAIDYYTLGHGSIMQCYNNSPSIDNRKIGFAFDLNFEKFGIESMYSDISSGAVTGIRGYVRPLQFTDLSSVPILSNFEVGASLASDLNERAGVSLATYDTVTQHLMVLKDEGNISIVGLDLGLPIIRASLANVSLYADYTKILNFGDGAAAGMLVNLNGLGLVNASVKFERRWNNAQFIPTYFNSLYEIERFKGVHPASTITNSKITELKYANDANNGYFGSLEVGVMKMFRVFGSYQRLDKTSNSGILQLRGEVTSESLPVLARAGYDKTKIIDETDIFRLDDRSYAFAELGYKLNEYLLASLIYNWTFTPLRDVDDNIIGYEPQKKFEPRISLIMPLNFGKTK